MFNAKHFMHSKNRTWVGYNKLKYHKSFPALQHRFANASILTNSKVILCLWSNYDYTELLI